MQNFHGFRLNTLQRQILGFIFTAILYFTSIGQADTNILAQYVPQAQEVGSGRLTVLFWNVYDATLYAPEAKWSPTTPYAISISYLRELSGKDIAKTSADAIRDLGFSDEATLDDWYRRMLMIFADVHENTTLIGIRNNQGQTLFYNNNQLAGIIPDPAFADWFFGIWLNEKTQKPDLRRKLLDLQEK